MPYFLEALIDLADGSLVSDCPLPCKTTQTQTKLLHKGSKPDDHYIDLAFSSKVRVTRTDLVKPTLTSFLSEVGLKSSPQAKRCKKTLHNLYHWSKQLVSLNKCYKFFCDQITFNHKTICYHWITFYHLINLDHKITFYH